MGLLPVAGIEMFGPITITGIKAKKGIPACVIVVNMFRNIKGIKVKKGIPACAMLVIRKSSIPVLILHFKNGIFTLVSSSCFKKDHTEQRCY